MYFYANSFKKLAKLAPEFVLHNQSHGINLEVTSDLDSEDVQHKIETFRNYTRYCHLDSEMLDLLLNPHVLSAIIFLNSNPSERSVLRVFCALFRTHATHEYSPEGQSNTLTITLASSYARVMNHLYDALECFVKAHILLYEIRTSRSATLLEDFSSCVQPLLDLREDTRQALELAESEANVAEALIKEVSPLETSNLSYRLTQSSFRKLSLLSTLLPTTMKLNPVCTISKG